MKEPLLEPDLEAQVHEGLRRFPGETSRSSSSAEADAGAAGAEEAEPLKGYKPRVLLGLNLDRLATEWKSIRLQSVPGYGRSLAGRRDLRFWVLPAVAACSMIAEGFCRNFKAGFIYENFLLVILVAGAMITPTLNWLRRVRDMAPDMFLAGVAFEHTRHGIYTLLDDPNWGAKNSVTWSERGILCSETLVMFWIVVLPLLAARQLFVVAWYLGALLVMYMLTGIPGPGTFAAAAVMMIPVIVAECKTAKIYDELHRCQTAAALLLRGTGGGLLTVDCETGHIIEASFEMKCYVGPICDGTHVSELVRLPSEKERLTSFVDCCRMGPWSLQDGNACQAEEDGYCSSTFFEAVQSKAEHFLSAFEVTTLRAAAAPDGVQARIVPYEKCAWKRTVKLWVQLKKFMTEDLPADQLQREDALAARTQELDDRELELGLAWKRVQALEDTLMELTASFRAHTMPATPSTAEPTSTTEDPLAQPATVEVKIPFQPGKHLEAEKLKAFLLGHRASLEDGSEAQSEAPKV